MSKPFDATVKKLVDVDPGSWLRLLLGREVGPATVLSADLATVVSEADEVLRVEADTPWLVHLEFQSSYDKSLPIRLQRYNILIRYRHELPVQSVAILLRREADGPAMTGTLRHHLPDGRLYHEFRYDVLRAWQLPVDQVLAGGLGTLPLAPICDEAATDLPDVLRQVQRRLVQDAGDQASDLWVSTLLLMGLRYAPGSVPGVPMMGNILEDSATYHWFVNQGVEKGLAQGRAEGVQQALIRIGTKRFGLPDLNTTAAIVSISDVERLQLLCERVLDVDGWERLLAEG